MKSIVQDTYGSADVLALRDIDRPEIGDDEVLVRVAAAGVDRGVWHLMVGLPYPIRLAGYGFRAPKRANPGMDVAGVVESVGTDVTRFAPGDEVFGIGRSTFAEYAVAPEKKLVPKPAGLTFEQAAAVPISGLTALQAVRDQASVEPGQKVLVIGASGGVGTYVVQLAKAFGAEVTGVCSTTKVDLVRSLGADHVIDYTAEDFTEAEGEYDVIIDIGGNTKLARLRRTLSPTGTLVFVGGETGGKVARRPAAPDRRQPALDVRASEPEDVRQQGEPRGPAHPDRADRGRQGHPGHRADLPPERGGQGHPAPGGGPRQGQARDHHLTHDEEQPMTGQERPRVLQMRLVVEASDYDEAVRFYRDVLGTQEELQIHGEGGEKVTILEVGRATLEISNPEQVEMIDRVEVGHRVSPHLRVAFEVADAQAVTDELVDAGATLIAAPTRTPWDSLNARLEGPGGLQLTLFEELATDPAGPGR